MDESDSAPGRVAGEMGAAAVPFPGSFAAREDTWRQFLTRAGHGDHDAFAAFYDATCSLVYSLALRILGNTADAEEVTMDVYVQVWRDPGRFDGERGNVGAWLLTMARSRALDRYRSSGARHRREEAVGVKEESDGGFSPEELAAMNQDRRRVASALATLSAEQRVAIELAYFKGLSQSELAEHLGVPLGTVKTRVRLGMMKLREQLGARRAS
jgi:RNA polymerase sigma-70 factor, ECF subfamily